MERCQVWVNDVPAWEPWIPPHWGNKEKDLRYWDGLTCRFTRKWVVEYTDLDVQFKMTMLPKFVTNGGSIPKFAWGLISPYGIGILAWFVHDANYGCHYFPRDISDLIMLRLLEYVELPWRRRQEAYWCVRAFGSGAYNSNVPLQDASGNPITQTEIGDRTVITPDYSRLYSSIDIIRVSEEYLQRLRVDFRQHLTDKTVVGYPGATVPYIA